MIDYESLPNKELNLLAAKICGWKFQYVLSPLPDYTNSLDLCIKDFVPVLNKKGLMYYLSGISIIVAGKGKEHHASIMKEVSIEGTCVQLYQTSHTNPARALTIAFLKSMEE